MGCMWDVQDRKSRKSMRKVELLKLQSSLKDDENDVERGAIPMLLHWTMNYANIPGLRRRSLLG